jgi:hypothetical protein
LVLTGTPLFERSQARTMRKTRPEAPKVSLQFSDVGDLGITMTMSSSEAVDLASRCHLTELWRFQHRPLPGGRIDSHHGGPGSTYRNRLTEYTSGRCGVNTSSCLKQCQNFVPTVRL